MNTILNFRKRKIPQIAPDKIQRHRRITLWNRVPLTLSKRLNSKNSALIIMLIKRWQSVTHKSVDTGLLNICFATQHRAVGVLGKDYVFFSYKEYEL